MRYFDPQRIINQSVSGRRRDGTFNVNDHELRGRTLENGVIELFFDESDQGVIRFHPDTIENALAKSKYTLSLRYVGESNDLRRMFLDAFHISVTQPTSVKKLGVVYAQGPSQHWINAVGRPSQLGFVKGHYEISKDCAEFDTDGWVHIVNGKLDSADVCDDRPINEVARKAMLKEVQRVRHLVRTRAKLGVFQDRQKNYRYDSNDGKPILKTLKQTNGENAKSLEKLLDVILTWHASGDVNKHAVNSYNNWINRHRKDLYEEFGLYAPASGGVQAAVPRESEAECA